jgi:hypothetical protein
MKRNIVSVIVMISLIAWSCSKFPSPNYGLRMSVEKGVADISTAVNKISGTTGYKLLSVSGDITKSDFIFNDTIKLSLVAGIYDFQPDTIYRFHCFSPYRLFKKTGESENMVVNMPEKFAFHPRYLHFYEPMDTIPPNNFTITATDYHIYFNWWHNYEYKLTAGFTLDGLDAGSMDVSSTSKYCGNNSYSSSFKFKDGYSISAVWQNGDTATSSFSLAHNTDTLFKESNVFIWHEDHQSEKQYLLTIGDIAIKKSTGVDSVQVFLNGVLQNKAAQIITDESDTTASVCHRRDILLTYDDGTTAKLSELLAPVRDEIAALRDSLHSMFFARRIVDFIAFSIYFDTHEHYF